MVNFFGIVLGLTSIVFFFKIKYHGVYAIAQTGRGRAVFEDVAKVGVAPSAVDLGSFHSMANVGIIDQAFFGEGFKEAGPSTGAVKFSITIKKGVAAGCAVIGAAFFVIPEFTGKGPFGSFFPGNMEEC